MSTELENQTRPRLSHGLSKCSDDQDLDARRQQIREKSNFLRGRFKSELKEFITLKNIINTAFILNICFICFYQCYLQLYEYFEYKTRIQVMHKLPSDSVYLVPGITICNNNRLRLNKLAEKVPSTRVDVEKILNETTVASLTARKRIEIMQSIRSAIDEHIDISSMIIKTPISELLEMSASPMIEDINCNTAWGEQINCENLRVVESFQGGPCYTAFYLGSLLEALGNGKAYDFQSSLLKKGKRKLTSFDSHEVAEVLVNFDPLNHGDIHQDIGGKISIHSTGHIGSIRDVAHTILPGFKYEVIVQRYMSKRLPPPYDSMCYDYKYYNSPKFLVSQEHSWSTELDKTTCTRNCIIKRTTKSCNCWPVEIPYFRGDTIVENADSYRMCAWGFDEANMGNFSSKLYVDCYRKFHAECREKCKLGCRTEDYHVHLVSNSWPGREKFLLASSDEERRELMRLKGCCAVISIKYSDLYEKVHIMIPNMTLAQMVSNIGGIVSALVGVSSITIYRHLTRKFFHCKIVNDHVPADILAPQARRVNNRIGQQHSIPQWAAVEPNRLFC